MLKWREKGEEKVTQPAFGSTPHHTGSEDVSGRAVAMLVKLSLSPTVTDFYDSFPLLRTISPLETSYQRNRGAFSSLVDPHHS